MMKSKFQKAISSFLVLSLSLLMTACSKNDAVKPYRYNPDLKRNNIASALAAENERFELRWDSESCMVVLSDKSSGKTFSGVPTPSEEASEFDAVPDNLLKMLSPITIDCVRSETYEIKTGYGADCIDRGNYSVSLIENGVRVTYIFDEFKVSVPVQYTLFDDGLKVELDPSKIAEDGGEYFLHTVALAPFLCNAKNLEKDSYLFYPSGSGALIGMNEERNISVNYSSDVYGRDRMSDVSTWCVETNTEEVRMPVFGTKRADDGVFAIIDSGAEMASISVDAFNSSIGYSSVYPEFAIRGETSVSNPFLSSSVNSVKYSDYYCLEKISVLYYPLVGKDVSYNDMADIYRDYLVKKGMTEKKNENVLSVKILGGTMVNDSVLGVPTREMFATATLSEAQEIVEDLNKNVDRKLNVDLIGYGKTGFEIGEVCGGFTVSGKLGGEKGLKNFYRNATDGGNTVFFDMDPISIAKSGSGYSVSNVAVTVTGQRGSENIYYIDTKNQKKLLCYFIARKQLPQVVEKSVTALNKFGVKGIALDAFSNYSYSDYADQKYYSKGKMGQDVSSLIKEYQKSDISVLTNAANIYAAAVSDLILDVPVGSSKMDFFSEEIPFYQMVLQGYIPMVSPSLNLSGDANAVLLKAAESGLGISYTLIQNFDGKLREEFDFYQNTCYDDLKSVIQQNYSQYKDLFAAVSNQKIVRHTVLSKGIHKTEFSNGIAVYTNFGDSEYDTPVGTVKPYSFLYGQN